MAYIVKVFKNRGRSPVQYVGPFTSLDEAVMYSATLDDMAEWIELTVPPNPNSLDRLYETIRKIMEDDVGWFGI